MPQKVRLFFDVIRTEILQEKILPADSIEIVDYNLVVRQAVDNLIANVDIINP